MFWNFDGGKQKRLKMYIAGLIWRRKRHERLAGLSESAFKQKSAAFSVHLHTSSRLTRESETKSSAVPFRKSVAPMKGIES